MASLPGSELSPETAFELLSPWDKELVYRLKQTYPQEVLSDLFSEPPTRMHSLTAMARNTI